MVILVLGSTGGIGSAIVNILHSEHTLICPTRQELALDKIDYEAMSEYLKRANPDVIINAAGVFGDNDIFYDIVFDVNLKANWSIIKHYMNNLPQKVVKFITIGSSAYMGGRRDYILYAASKAALHSMFESTSEFFADSNFLIGLVHPRKVDTKMLDTIQGINKSNCLDPNTVAKKIIDFVGNLTISTYININN